MPIYSTDKAVFIAGLERLTWDGVCKPLINRCPEINIGITSVKKTNVNHSNKSRLRYVKSCSREA